MGIEGHDWGCGLHGESENITWRKIVQGLSRSPFNTMDPLTPDDRLYHIHAAIFSAAHIFFRNLHVRPDTLKILSLFRGSRSSCHPLEKYRRAEAPFGSIADLDFTLTRGVDSRDFHGSVPMFIAVRIKQLLMRLLIFCMNASRRYGPAKNSTGRFGQTKVLPKSPFACCYILPQLLSHRF
jgi:hypothetical protein